MKYKILIIEDDPEAAECMSFYLVRCGFLVEYSVSAISGISLAVSKKFDLVILDINLPDYNGFQVCSKIRNSSSIPIIFVSAHSDCDSHIQAFKLGADDFLAKPINMEILSLHIWAVLRRSSNIPSPDLNNINFKLDLKNRKIEYKNTILKLTTVEYEILHLLILNIDNIVSRDRLIHSISRGAEVESLNYHIKNIRKKISESGGDRESIKTIYGAGYMLLSNS